MKKFLACILCATFIFGTVSITVPFDDKMPNSKDVWKMGKYVVTVTSIDEKGNAETYKIPEYHFIWNVGNYERYKEYMTITRGRKQPPTVYLCYGAVDEVDDLTTIPIKQKFEWEVTWASDKIIREDIEFAKKLAATVPVDRFPFNFAFIAYTPGFETASLYMHPIFDKNDRVHERMEMYMNGTWEE